jgi:large subunit ribosomal protein L5
MVATAKKPVSAARLRDQYRLDIAPKLLKELKLKNIHEVPHLQKIVLNIGLGRVKDDKRAMEIANNTLRKITGQQPVQTKAKKAIASFKLRQGNKIGIKVTLRGERMYEFMDRLINIVIPRLRDFHGVNRKAFDRQGNYSIGINDQSIFPELTFEDTAFSHGLQIIFVIKSKSIEQSQELLLKFGMPFEKESK